MAEFKKISDVDVINTLTDNDNVVIVGADGVLKQTSSGNLGMDITKTEVVEAPEEADNLVLVSNGAVKQIPAATFAAASGGGNEPIYLVTASTSDPDLSGYTLLDGSTPPTNLYDLFLAGTPIFKVRQVGSNMSTESWAMCIGATASQLDFADSKTIAIG